MDKKRTHQTPRGRPVVFTEQKNDTAFRLWFLGLNAQLTTDLRHLYEGSLSEPLPEKVRELLVRLAEPEPE